jgi:PAS domain-containing protein
MAEGTTQRHLVLILARNFASRLATPVWLVDAQGAVIYFNEAAEAVVGRRFVEGRGLPAGEWSTMISPLDERGVPLRFDDLPLSVSIREGRPDHAILRIRSLDGVDRRIAVTAFPLFAHPGESLGAIAIFWEMPQAEAGT